LQSCIDYKNGTGYILVDKKHHPTKVDVMFIKTIKLLIANMTEGYIFFVTEDVEVHEQFIHRNKN